MPRRGHDHVCRARHRPDLWIYGGEQWVEFQSLRRRKRIGDGALTWYGFVLMNRSVVKCIDAARTGRKLPPALNSS
jgi:hypothetical protein